MADGACSHTAVTTDPPHTRWSYVLEKIYGGIKVVNFCCHQCFQHRQGGATPRFFAFPARDSHRQPSKATTITRCHCGNINNQFLASTDIAIAVVFSTTTATALDGAINTRRRPRWLRQRASCCFSR
ncbi:unnamed protein product, partial [Ectocarpus sp. 12 AP-2014]